LAETRQQALLRSFTMKPRVRPLGRAARRGRRTQEERRETTRRKLLEAATDCIARFGLANSSLGVIAKHASVTRGAVQHHFGTRNELLLAVVDEFGQQLFTLSRNMDERLTPLAARIDRVCSRYWEIFSSPHFLAVIQIWLGVQNEPRINRSVLNRIRWFEVELDRQWIELFSDSVVGEKGLRAARHVTLGTMRGLALRMTYSRDDSNSLEEIEVLKTMLGKTLESA
jgi:AcrR family transcriptional regulator